MVIQVSITEKKTFIHIGQFLDSIFHLCLEVNKGVNLMIDFLLVVHNLKQHLCERSIRWSVGRRNMFSVADSLDAGGKVTQVFQFLDMGVDSLVQAVGLS